MALDASDRTVLLLHDGELHDIRSILDEIGARVSTASSGHQLADAECDLVVATPRHMRAVAERGLGAGTPRLAVLDQDSRTLRAMLQRTGATLVVRRPVHPAALRALLLHSLYRGPERRSRRVVVGLPVRFRVGFRRRDGILADLSMRGCRLLVKQPVAEGQRLSVQLPEQLGGGRGFSVRGKVVRAQEKDEEGNLTLGVDFGALSRGLATRMKQAVMAHLQGPAVMPQPHAVPPSGDTPEGLQPSASTSPLPTAPSPAVARRPEARESACSPAFPSERSTGFRFVRASGQAQRPAAARIVAPAPRALVERDAASAVESNRRNAKRHEYERRVVALGEQAARVLLGRDVSSGGMRVDSHPALTVGQELRLALHVGAGETPLVVRARVSRDDGPSGLALRFCNLPDPSRDQLEKLMSSLPVLAGGPHAQSGVIVSEILDS